MTKDEQIRRLEIQVEELSAANLQLTDSESFWMDRANAYRMQIILLEHEIRNLGQYVSTTVDGILK